tara:strand:- start:2530 stop:3522 length:993 start_codon:yes stop_codon:yes gene_type:complete
MNYIKMAPLSGLAGYGGGTSGLTLAGAAAPDIWYGDRGIASHSHTGYEYITISSTGNSSSFGSQVEATVMSGGMGSTSRCIFFGGSYNYDNSTDDIEYIDPTTTGNGTNFGDLSDDRKTMFTGSDGSRGIAAGGNYGQGDTLVQTIEYVTIATTGNASSFGTGVQPELCMQGQVSNDTYALFGGGGSYSGQSSFGQTDDVRYVTIQSPGNQSSSIGNLTEARRQGAACCSPTRGVWFGGTGANAIRKNIIDYRTLDNSSENCTDFGDVDTAVGTLAGTANETRGVFQGGYTDSTQSAIRYITIGSPSNSSTFGALSGSRYGVAAASGGAV